MNKKILIAYFSASGQTKRLAHSLAEVMGADLFEIQPETPYTSADLNWRDKKSRSTVEMKVPASRPAIAHRIENMDAYDVVLVGFPIWWYIAPSIINTFLESYDFSGKIMVPFATSGGSGLGETESKLHSVCPDTVKWRPGRLLSSGAPKEALSKWVESLRL